MDLSRVGMSELKAGLSRYVGQARAGGVVEITIHNKPVARLAGIAATAPDGLARLIASGGASWSGRKFELPPLVRLSEGGTSLSDMVIEDRG